ncbi:MAG: hypothetical protein FJ303_00775 [Planctomycetes bacterium]|nr:hypothetical protein [Planctomycetota bacterium]
MARFMVNARYNLLAAVVLFATGCGLADYQDRLDQQAARVQKFDEANRLLDEPIELPRMPDPADPNTEKNAWPFDPYLRLPRGYSALPKEKTPYPDRFTMFRYAGGGEGATAIFVTAAWVASGKDAKEDAETFTPATFRSRIAVGLADYYAKEYKGVIKFTDKVDPQPREVKALTFYPHPTNPSKIAFKYYAYSDQGHREPKDVSIFEVYLREEAGMQIAIIVQRPVQLLNPTGFTKAIEACLGSLELGSKTDMRRTSFRKARTP